MHSYAVTPIVLKSGRTPGKRPAVEEEYDAINTRPIKTIKEIRADAEVLRGRPLPQDIMIVLYIVVVVIIVYSVLSCNPMKLHISTSRRQRSQARSRVTTCLTELVNRLVHSNSYDQLHVTNFEHR
jgi:hypothetical protein